MAIGLFSTPPCRNVTISYSINISSKIFSVQNDVLNILIVDMFTTLEFFMIGEGGLSKDRQFQILNR